MSQVWEELSEQVLGQNPNVSSHVVVENEPGGYGRLVLSAPPLALPVGQVDRRKRIHVCRSHVNSGEQQRISGWSCR